MRNPLALYVLLLLTIALTATAQEGDALARASREGDIATVKRLLSGGAAVDARDSHGVTALAHAAFADSGAVVQVLLDAGADPHRSDPRGRTAWLWSAHRGSDDAAEVFLKAGVDVDATTADGVTALMVAALMGHDSTARILLQAGAKVELTDANGATAADWARDRGHTRIALLIEGHDSSPELPSDPWDIPLEASYLSDAEREIVQELNRVRSNPARYAEEVIKPLIGAFEGQVLRFPGEIPIMTEEGAEAVRECYRVLVSSQPVGPLTPRPGLSRAAQDHVLDQGPRGLIGHTGTDGSQPRDRVERYEKDPLGTWGENVAYGWRSPRRIVFALLVDDGVADRGHRKNIMNPRYQTVGVSIGEHSRYGWVSVMEFATFR